MNHDPEDDPEDDVKEYDGWDDESDSTDIPPVKPISYKKMKKLKEKGAKEEEAKKRNATAKEDIRKIFEASGLKYPNQEIIDNIDNKVKARIANKFPDGYRDKLFPWMIDEFGFKTGAEIGVDTGEFSNHILSKSRIEKYYCIDTWQDNFGSDCPSVEFDKSGDKRFNDAQNALASYGNRAVMMRMPSVEASKQIPDNSLDFVYIDGDHSLEMLFDLYAWVPKVRLGGVISGHDYKNGPKSGITDFWGRQLDYQIKTCADYYCLRYGYRLNIVGGRILNWYFVKNG